MFQRRPADAGRRIPFFTGEPMSCCNHSHGVASGCCGTAENDSEITPEQWAEVHAIIARHKETPGALITVLREAQGVVGYFPTELLDCIAKGMNIPASDVFGVVSFYSLFSLNPKGRHTIKVCTGTACYVKGIREVINRIASEYGIREGETTEDRRFDLEGVRCLGACGLAPVMVVGEDTHGAVSADRVLELLKKYT
jgi:NADH-quinone oxidoreductase subunit E